mgnify:FL=1
MKYLMVCHGNICRSPMAMGLLRHKLAKLGSDSEVDSCGFEPYHIGDAPDKRAQKILAEKGIDISGHRARLFTTEDFDKFDHIFVMDRHNFKDILAQSRGDEDMKKVQLLLDVVYPGEHLEVPGPYYGLDQAFRTTYAHVSGAAEEIIETYEKKQDDPV